MEEKKMNDDTEMNVGMLEDALIDTLKEVTIKFSKDSYICRILTDTIHLINRQKEEISLLKKQPITPSVIDLSVENGLLKDKIERMTKLYDETNSELFDRNIELEDCEQSNKSLQTMNFNLSQDNAELKKQVDELKSENTELYKEHTALIAGSILKKQEIAKYTAKEILTKANELWLDTINPNCLISKIERWIKERYGVEVE